MSGGCVLALLLALLLFEVLALDDLELDALDESLDEFELEALDELEELALDVWLDVELVDVLVDVVVDEKNQSGSGGSRTTSGPVRSPLSSHLATSPRSGLGCPPEPHTSWPTTYTYWRAST